MYTEGGDSITSPEQNLPRFQLLWPGRIEMFTKCSGVTNIAYNKPVHQFGVKLCKVPRHRSTPVMTDYNGWFISCEIDDNLTSIWFVDIVDHAVLVYLKIDIIYEHYALSTLSTCTSRSQHVLRKQLHPSTAKLFNLNFHPLEVASRWRDPQLQVSENYSDWTKWRSTVIKYCWLIHTLSLTCLKGGT